MKVEKLYIRIRNFWFDLFSFNFLVAFTNFIWPLSNILPTKFTRWIINLKHIHVKKYLNKYFLITSSKEYSNSFLNTFNGNNGKLPIWVCWLQGEDMMPFTVKICYKSLIKHSNGHNVNLITFDNYSSYINIPDFIVNKLHKGNITYVHFTDIIRICLIEKYGGLWIDSTIFVSNDIDDDIFNFSFYSIKNQEWGYFISKCRWSLYFLAGQKNNILFVKLKKLLFDYWFEEERIVDYFLVDYFIDFLYNSDDKIKLLIDNVPFSNETINELNECINDVIDIDNLYRLFLSTRYSKLTFKRKYKIVNNKGFQTYFGKIVEITNSFEHE